jgi:hypothetical protein
LVAEVVAAAGVAVGGDMSSRMRNSSEVWIERRRRRRSAIQ